MVRSIALVFVACLASACDGDDDSGDVQVDGDAAPGDPDAAPPGGDGGGRLATCEEYCEVLIDHCIEKMRQYLDLESCLSTCPVFPPGQPGDASGDSLACRMHYAEIADTDPATYCPRAGPAGDGSCGDSCDGYCDIMMSTCDGFYADDAECMEVCAGLPDPRPYTIFESRTDTVGCRIFHGSLATVHVGHCGTASEGSLACVDE